MAAQLRRYRAFDPEITDPSELLASFTRIIEELPDTFGYTDSDVVFLLGALKRQRSFLLRYFS